MKELMITIAALLNISVNAQSLKGYTLGEKLNRPELIMTTVAGIKGGVGVETLKDSTIAMIMFIPSTSDEQNVARITQTELDRLKTGIEQKYQFTFTKEEEEYSENFKYSALRSSDYSLYIIRVDYNQFFDRPYQIAFSITTRKLFSLYQDEEQKKANADF
ncbi:MAG: hypothetical protein RBS73_11010 [Prolixibacteraceae bacterium]|jgi:hypothetical protein|nr:hypothetical protein [Prolixibacteraceae bacterium]